MRDAKTILALVFLLFFGAASSSAAADSEAVKIGAFIVSTSEKTEVKEVKEPVKGSRIGRGGYFCGDKPQKTNMQSTIGPIYIVKCRTVRKTVRVSEIKVERHDGKAFALSTNKANRTLRRFCRNFRKVPDTSVENGSNQGPKKVAHVFRATCE